VTTLLTGVTIVLERKKSMLQDANARLTVELVGVQAELKTEKDKLLRHINATVWTDRIYQDVVMLGPRQSGKTSIVKLWTEPWTDIERIRAGDHWECHEREIGEVDRERRFCSEDGTDRTYLKKLWLRIHDYPGEDRYRAMALDKLPEMSGVVLVFVLDGDEAKTQANGDYYSTAFVSKLEALENFAHRIKKAYVVFSKADLAGAACDPETTREKLMDRNRPAMDRLKSQFSGILDVFVTSAETNQHIVNLLGAVCCDGFPTDKRERIISNMRSKGLQV
jgi:hypothetical protein